MNRPIRLLIVDDSKFFRQILRRLFRDDPAIEIVGEGRTGEDAVRMNAELTPDVITLDIDMPEMGGLEALDRIMTARPVPVIIISSHTREQAEMTFRALEHGAVDFIDKGRAGMNMDMHRIGQEIREKIGAVAGVSPEIVRARVRDAVETGSDQAMQAAARGLVVIGASTGGPPLVQRIVKSLTRETSTALLIVQHMPVGFTYSFAERLNRNAAIEVHEAVHGEPILAGQGYVAPAGHHVRIHLSDSGPKFEMSDRPAHRHKPSIDVAMKSVAETYGRRALGVILTGMGRDGADGLAAMATAKAFTYAQDQESSVVWSMPEAAIKAGAVATENILSIPSIIERIEQWRTGEEYGVPAKQA